MAVTKVCCTCLSFDVKMFPLTDDNVRECFQKLTDKKIETEDELLHNVCEECVVLMRKFVKFKDRCLEANQRLKQILTQSIAITEELLEAEINKLYSDTTVELDEKPMIIDKNLIKSETYLQENASNVTFENPLESKGSILKDILCKTDENRQKRPDLVKTEHLEYEIEINDVFSPSSEEDLIEEQTLPTCKYDNTLKDGISHRNRKCTKSTRKNKPLKKAKLPVSRSAPTYAVKITLSEQEEMNEFLSKTASVNYLNARFQCTHCIQGFISEEKFEQHQKLHDESRGAWECNLCKLRYCNMRRLKQHQMTHNFRYKCLTCGGLTKSKRRAVVHQNRHLGIMYECQLCSEKFQHEQMYKMHTRTAHPTKHACDLCGDYFGGQALLQKHKEANSKCWKARKMRLDCKRCEMPFFKFRLWYVHMVNHARDKEQSAPTECQICGHKTSSWSDWSFHINKQHRNIHHKPYKPTDQRVPMKFVCDVCGKKMRTKYSLCYHMRSQHPDIQTNLNLTKKITWMHTCEICNKQFQRNNIKRHMLIHTGEKPFKCEHCGMCFTQLNTKENHVKKIHENLDQGKRKRRRKPTESKQNTGDASNEKPFTCDICQRTYSSKYYLEFHRNVHTGEKPYNCDICDMRFTQKASVKRHQLVHTGVKNYSCDLCGNTFTQKESLNLHVKSVHLKIPPRPRNRTKKNKEHTKPLLATGTE